ncbi:hypothetical protein D3Z51_13440 [Clostridiaceae bacterium]|nr:hypothetical protein [Clostridiaceae bacterium]RKI11237.1 hypothetical protein D7V81_14415 [bacterium 1XD21-70]
MKRWVAACCALVFGAAAAFPAMAGEWELTEDGKYWNYCESPGNPIKDEWIEDNGKTYYLDSSGKMKTGWVTEEDSGNRYFMGEDGAMCRNAFTKDDRYVGADGLRVERYDNYRKAVKSELKKAARKKTSKQSSRRGAASAKGVEERQQYFLMADLNLDEYMDLVVTEGTEENMSLVEIAIWDPEEEKFQLSAEFDEPEEGTVRSNLYRDPQGETVWLELAEPNGDLRLFQMADQDSGFKSVWSFAMELDDWGGPVYLVNGQEEDKEEWDQDMAEALRTRGNEVMGGYLPATDENIKAQVDRVLTEEELGLW